jgi:hypothetical protein
VAALAEYTRTGEPSTWAFHQLREWLTVVELWYNDGMSTPGGAIAPYQTGQVSTEPVSPSAVSSAKSGAVFALGEVLKTLLHNAVGAFHTEGDLDAAIRVVDKFVGAHVPGSEMDALLTGDQRAPKEDVTKRIPPGGVVQPVITGPVIDYQALAKAILAEQQKYQAQTQTQVEGGPTE